MTAAGFSILTRKQGIKLGAGSLCSMDRVVVLFLEKVEQVKLLVEKGVAVNGLFEAVQLLIQPAARNTLSSAPPSLSASNS